MKYKSIFNIFVMLFAVTLISCGGGGAGDDGYTDPYFGDIGSSSTDLSSKFITADESSTTAINLSWDSQYTADLYKIYRNGVLIATVTGTQYLDSNLTPNTNYYYQYSIVESGVESNYSLEVMAFTLSNPTTVPAAPTSLGYWSITATSIDVDWRDSSTNEDGFKVRRNNILIATIPFGDVSSYEDTGLTADTNYDYSITSYNSFGESSPANITLTTLHPATTPAAPTNVNVSAVTNNSITLSFTDNATNEDGYVISVDGTTNKTFCDGVNLTSCQMTGLTSNTTYDLTIKAFTLTSVSNTLSFYIPSSGIQIQGTTAQ